MRRAFLSCVLGLSVAAPVCTAWAYQDNGVNCTFEDCEDIPWAWEDGRAPPPPNPPLPQGFALTVPVPFKGGSGTPQLTRYVDIGDALGRCWSAAPLADDRHWGALTLRVSFKRDGSINGVPFIPFVAEQSEAAETRKSLLAALSHCVPLNFSPSLGQAVAGQIFAIRFIQQGKS